MVGAAYKGTRFWFRFSMIMNKYVLSMAFSNMYIAEAAGAAYTCYDVVRFSYWTGQFWISNVGRLDCRNEQSTKLKLLFSNSNYGIMVFPDQ